LKYNNCHFKSVASNDHVYISSMQGDACLYILEQDTAAHEAMTKHERPPDGRHAPAVHGSVEPSQAGL